MDVLVIQYYPFFPNIKEYSIIDLPDMLNLSNSYLSKVLSENNFQKIKFYSVNNIENINYDLVINIDSMQEMSENTVKSYLDYININSRLFYTKNTICKFDPAIFNWKKSNNSELAINSGILKEIANIFCPNELKKAQENFIKAFSPGNNWHPIEHKISLPYSHYYQALYIKNI